MKKFINYLCLLLLSSVSFAQNLASESHTLSYDSPYNFTQTIESLREVVKGNNYLAFRTRYLLENLGGKVNKKQAIIRFCNFATLKDFLKVEPKLGILLPCRIYVSELKNGKVKVFMKNYRQYIMALGDKKLFEQAKPIIEQIEELIENAL